MNANAILLNGHRDLGVKFRKKTDNQIDTNNSRACVDLRDQDACSVPGKKHVPSDCDG